MKNNLPHGSLDVQDDNSLDDFPPLNSAGLFWVVYLATVAAGFVFLIATIVS